MQIWQYRPLVTARLLYMCSDNRTWTSLLDIYHPDPWPVAATTVFGAPDDGRRKRPEHV